MTVIRIVGRDRKGDGARVCSGRIRSSDSSRVRNSGHAQAPTSHLQLGRGSLDLLLVTEAPAECGGLRSLESHSGDGLATAMFRS